MEAERTMTLADALQVLADLRNDQVVVTTMSAAREWMCQSTHPFDFHYVPSTMGGAFALGLGIALARPDREVLVLNGDGCLLMNLGSLVTVSVNGPENFTGIIIDNGNFETTGGQKLATTDSSIPLGDFARAAQFVSVSEFDSLSTWKEGAAAALTQPGPRCIVLKVAPAQGEITLKPPGPMADRVTALRAALNS
jgi:thiamine pyrophosphate-dependent acetolactate synthase large subunit-like protein